MIYYEYNSSDPNYYQNYVDIILTQNLSFTNFYLGQGCYLYIRNNNGKLEQLGIGGEYDNESLTKDTTNLQNFKNGYIYLKKVNGQIVDFDEYIKINHPEIYNATSLF